MPDWSLRPATLRDRDAVVPFWRAGWHAAHAALAPPDVLRWRRRVDFEAWYADSFPAMTLAVDGDRVLGFYALQGAELEKFYIADDLCGGGFAVQLLAAAEADLARRGRATAELYCLEGNAAAARFYRRHGWRFAETRDEPVWAPPGVTLARRLPTWRYEKRLAPSVVGG